ncbi:NYN domain-containing protein [Patescibacteria group bacterium]|nr:NYN domain-containing protein [Patescibacteria group bacterium]
MNIAQHKEQRVGVFVDVQNMYYSAKNLYQAKVDFGRVLNSAVAGRRLIRAFAYVIKADVGAEKEFFEALNKLGYEVRQKELQVFYGGAKKGDWDVGLCMDVVRLIPKIDAVVLVSGDGDYVDLLEYAQSQGVRTEIIGFGKTVSSRLLDETDYFLDMSRSSSKFLIGKPKFSLSKGDDTKEDNH